MPTPHVFSRSAGSAVVHELWETQRRRLPTTAAMTTRSTAAFRLPPPKNGSVFRIIEYPPDTRAARGDRAGSAPCRTTAPGRTSHATAAIPRHAGFHKTDSIDYAIVLSGEIYALMDEGEVLLKTGDVLIQRGTNHAWSNRTDEPAYVAFVLIDAEPV